MAGVPGGIRVVSYNASMPLTTAVQPPIASMLAKLTEAIPEGPDWLFEPKWDGFRCIVFFDGQEVYLKLPLRARRSEPAHA